MTKKNRNKITQLELIKGKRRPMPRPTVRHGLENRDERFNSRKAIQEYYEEEAEEIERIEVEWGLL